MDKQKEAISSILFGVSAAEYGDDFNDHLLTQYLKFVEMADKISDRRSIANMFFLTLNTAFLSAIGISNILIERQSCNLYLILSMLVVAIAFCFMWFRLIISYRDLNTAKFKVIHEIEQRLPARMFDAEWEAVERGENNKLYFPFTHIEKYIPWVFIVLYLFLIYCLIFAK
jgi:hypothetical protein